MNLSDIARHSSTLPASVVPHDCSVKLLIIIFAAAGLPTQSVESTGFKSGLSDGYITGSMNTLFSRCRKLMMFLDVSRV